MPDHDVALEIQPAAAHRWDDLVTLFEQRGMRGGRQPTANCWCIVWRDKDRKPDGNRQVLCDRVSTGDVPGLLAYRGGECVGWVSVAPREHFQSLLRSTRFRPHDSDAGVFVITCFAVAPRHRGAGIGRVLLEAAVDHALGRGATAVEAYPSDPADYKGRPEWFCDYGFLPVREIGKRTLVRYTPG